MPYSTFPNKGRGESRVSNRRHEPSFFLFLFLVIRHRFHEYDRPWPKKISFLDHDRFGMEFFYTRGSTKIQQMKKHCCPPFWITTPCLVIINEMISVVNRHWHTFFFLQIEALLLLSSSSLLLFNEHIHAQTIVPNVSLASDGVLLIGLVVQGCPFFMFVTMIPFIITTTHLLLMLIRRRKYST